MQIRLERPLAEQFLKELHDAGGREIGGLLMGEHLHDDVFRLAEISVQHTGGTHSGFIRTPEAHEAQLEIFFEQTCNNYKRFNYLGEWHSHPHFSPFPSNKDIRTMQSIVDDPGAEMNFLVLLIVRLTSGSALAMSATAFRRQVDPCAVQVVADIRQEGCPESEDPPDKRVSR